MRFKKGDKVIHPTKKDWGLGKVIEDSNGDTVKVFFVKVGEKRLSLKHVNLIKVSENNAKHPLLDNLKIYKPDNNVKFQALGESIEYFLAKYPDGFYGKKFIEEERDYKMKAHLLATELLSKDEFKELLNKKDYDNIVKHLLKIVNSTNLIFPNEKIALKNGLDKYNNLKDVFCKNIYFLLYDEINIENHFQKLAELLKDLEAHKWTIATYFLFIMFPEKYMFVKPTVTKHAAELCGFEINYKAEINWLTYKLILELSNYLFSELSNIGLKPRDMIDIQSFMWCIVN